MSVFDELLLCGKEGRLEPRDYFAAKALTGLIACPIDKTNDKGQFVVNAESLSKCAYALADAMMEQRKKGASK